MISELISQYREWQQARQARAEEALIAGQVELFRSLANCPGYTMVGVPILDSDKFARVTSGMNCIATTSDIVQGQARLFYRNARFFHDGNGIFYFEISACYTDEEEPFMIQQGVVLNWEEID